MTDGSAFDITEFDEREQSLIEHFAIAMHALTCGDWRAAGYETKLSFRVAAAYAVIALNGEGHDLLSILPPSTRGRVVV